MKKLLLVLLVVSLAAFLFVGCIPTTPGEGEGEGEGEAEICPTVHVTTQVEVGGKTYIKGDKQTITVTFAVPTEPVSVYVGPSIKALPVGVPDNAAVVVMYANADKTVYTGTYLFTGTCNPDYIYVLTCDTCAPCKYPYIVDSVDPYATIEVCIDACVCAGCALSFTSTSETECAVTTEDCGDACSGLASWSIDIYDKNPFVDKCCDMHCETPIDSGSGVCPVDFTTICLTKATPYYVVVTLVDNVGNDTKFGAAYTINPDTCTTITVADWDDYGCLDTGEKISISVASPVVCK